MSRTLVKLGAEVFLQEFLDGKITGDEMVSFLYSSGVIKAMHKVPSGYVVTSPTAKKEFVGGSLIPGKGDEKTFEDFLTNPETYKRGWEVEVVETDEEGEEKRSKVDADVIDDEQLYHDTVPEEMRSAARESFIITDINEIEQHLRNEIFSDDTLTTDEKIRRFKEVEGRYLKTASDLINSRTAHIFNAAESGQMDLPEDFPHEGGAHEKRDWARREAHKEVGQDLYDLYAVFSGIRDELATLNDLTEESRSILAGDDYKELAGEVSASLTLYGGVTLGRSLARFVLDKFRRYAELEYDGDAEGTQRRSEVVQVMYGLVDRFRRGNKTQEMWSAGGSSSINDDVTLDLILSAGNSAFKVFVESQINFNGISAFTRMFSPRYDGGPEFTEARNVVLSLTTSSIDSNKQAFKNLMLPENTLHNNLHDLASGAADSVLERCGYSQSERRKIQADSRAHLALHVSSRGGVVPDLETLEDKKAYTTMVTAEAFLGVLRGASATNGTVESTTASRLATPLFDYLFDGNPYEFHETSGMYVRADVVRLVNRLASAESESEIHQLSTKLESLRASGEVISVHPNMAMYARVLPTASSEGGVHEEEARPMLDLVRTSLTNQGIFPSDLSNKQLFQLMSTDTSIHYPAHLFYRNEIRNVSSILTETDSTSIRRVQTISPEAVNHLASRAEAMDVLGTHASLDTQILASSNAALKEIFGTEHYTEMTEGVASVARISEIYRTANTALETARRKYREKERYYIKTKKAKEYDSKGEELKFEDSQVGKSWLSKVSKAEDVLNEIMDTARREVVSITTPDRAALASTLLERIFAPGDSLKTKKSLSVRLQGLVLESYIDKASTLDAHHSLSSIIGAVHPWPGTREVPMEELRNKTFEGIVIPRINESLRPAFGEKNVEIFNNMFAEKLSYAARNQGNTVGAHFEFLYLPVVARASAGDSVVDGSMKVIPGGLMSSVGVPGYGDLTVPDVVSWAEEVSAEFPEGRYVKSVFEPGSSGAVDYATVTFDRKTKEMTIHGMEGKFQRKHIDLPHYGKGSDTIDVMFTTIGRIAGEHNIDLLDVSKVLVGPINVWGTPQGPITGAHLEDSIVNSGGVGAYAVGLNFSPDTSRNTSHSEGAGIMNGRVTKDRSSSVAPEGAVNDYGRYTHIFESKGS